MFDPAPRYILDTNIWLDWFVFACEPDTPMALLKNTMIQQGATVLMTQAMWDEWVDVLGRAQFKVEPERQADILAHTRELVAWTPTPPTPFDRIRCSDKDDQVFIDMALALKADWLISKDKHLLCLHARAKKRGVMIATPEQWVRQFCHTIPTEMIGVACA
ncbi:MAG: hypothetical protein H6R05_1577 [Burkholderiaceae bacterium]|nr:hypothetical protein [Burkholderiaceae bacterium]